MCDDDVSIIFVAHVAQQIFWRRRDSQGKIIFIISDYYYVMAAVGEEGERWCL